jgi:hypothetical protein
MPDRIAVYKTPLQRLAEIIVIFLIAAGSAALSHALLPGVSAAPAIILALIAGSLLVSRFGAVWAGWRGGAVLTEHERSRRYLAEIMPGRVLLRGLAPTSARRNRGGRTLG